MNDLDTLTVLKLLAKGRPRHMVAAAVGVTPAEVDQVGGENGMPDQHLLRAAARRLESELAATIPTAAAAREHPLVFSPVMEPASGGNAEGERTKRCSKCRTPKPLSGFHVDRRRSDGLCLQCKECMREAPSQRYRPYTPSRAVRTRARQRALRRLAELHPRDFAGLMAEEIEKARAELEPLKAAADATGKGTSHTQRHDPVRRRKPVGEIAALLKGGPRPAGQSPVERLRDDVGRCPLCIDSHDRGHICPACGAAPDERSA